MLEVELDQSTKKEINNLSLQAFNKLGCSNWGRVDILEDAIGNFYVLEINTVPGMTSHSCVPRSAELAGISYKELVQLIIKDVQI